MFPSPTVNNCLRASLGLERGSEEGMSGNGEAKGLKSNRGSKFVAYVLLETVL